MPFIQLSYFLSMTTKNKKQLLTYVVLTGLLFGSIGAISMPAAIAESYEENEYDEMYYELERQHIAILESFGFVEPELTDAQYDELDKRLEPLEVKYDEIFAEDFELTAEEEIIVDQLDAEYDAILESYGFKFPELTEQQEKELDEMLSPIEEKFMELEYGFDEECNEPSLTSEQKDAVKSLNAQYDVILEEFGFTVPQLSESQEEELDKRFCALDAEYEKILSQYHEELSQSEMDELDKRLDALDAKDASIMSEFGFVEPQLTDAQEEELEERLSPLDAQYDEIFWDFE